MPVANGATALRGKLTRGELVWSHGAHDVLSAIVIEKAGFDAVAVQSFQWSLSRGLPDVGMWSPQEATELTRNVANAVQLPIIVDMEQGFGDVYNTVYWMRQIESVGAAAVHIDDYGHLYKCPWMPPYIPWLTPAEEVAEKIKAMVGERRMDLIIIGRSGAYVSSGFSDVKEARREAIRRSRLFKEAGADAILCTAKALEELKIFRAEVEGPIMIQLGYRSGDPDPMDHSVDTLLELGFQIINEPSSLITTGLKAAYEALCQERASRIPSTILQHRMSLAEVHEWMRVGAMVETANRYRDA